jgi:hypothetical protein
VFEIKPNTEEAVQYFINLLKPETQAVLNANKALIFSVFNASNAKNLRVLQRALFNYERLLNLLDQDLKKDAENYELLTRSLLGYYLIFHIEYNTGNLNIVDFQQLFIGDEKNTITKAMKRQSNLTVCFIPQSYLRQRNYLDSLVTVIMKS